MTLQLGKTYAIPKRSDGRLVIDMSKCPPEDQEPSWRTPTPCQPLFLNPRVLSWIDSLGIGWRQFSDQHLVELTAREGVVDLTA